MTKKTKAPKSTAVIGYVRVSTSEQAEKGQSLEAQKEKIRNYCQMRGLELAEVIVDAGVSGGTPLPERQGGISALSALARGGASGIVAVKLDRLFRSALDCLQVVDAWDRAGVALHLVDMGGQTLDTSTSAGKLFVTMLSGFAEFERSLISERTSAVLQNKKAQKQLVGTVPFGSKLGRDGIHLEKSPREQAIIEYIMQLDGEGLSLRAIAARVGNNPRNGRAFAAQQIKNIILANH